MKWVVCLGLAVCLVAGVCGCGQGVAEETEVTTTEVMSTTTEATTTEITTTESTAEPFENTFTQRIHKSMPKFAFVLRGGVRQPDNWPDVEFADIRSIEISDPNGKFYQLFGEIEVEKEAFVFYRQDEMLSLADYNNDGYLDLRLQLVAERNRSDSLFWLWDITQQRFVENEQLKELSWSCNLHLNDDGILIGSNTAGGGIGWGYSIYEFKNGAFIETESYYWLVERDGVYLSTYQLIDGEMTLISTKLWEEDQ